MVKINHYLGAYLAGETVGNAVATYKNMRYNQQQMKQRVLINDYKTKRNRETY